MRTTIVSQRACLQVTTSAGVQKHRNRKETKITSGCQTFRGRPNYSADIDRYGTASLSGNAGAAENDWLMNLLQSIEVTSWQEGSVSLTLCKRVHNLAGSSWNSFSPLIPWPLALLQYGTRISAVVGLVKKPRCKIRIRQLPWGIVCESGAGMSVPLMIDIE